MPTRAKGFALPHVPPAVCATVIRWLSAIHPEDPTRISLLQKGLIRTRVTSTLRSQSAGCPPPPLFLSPGFRARGLPPGPRALGAPDRCGGAGTTKGTTKATLSRCLTAFDIKGRSLSRSLPPGHRDRSRPPGSMPTHGV